jgi:deoxyribodipyrimidine photo-lyase
MTGGRLNRFNIVKQSKDYDQHGDYVRLWLPELKDVPTALVHEPWKMTQFQQIEFNVRLGVDYPHPIVPPSNVRSGGDSQQQPRKQQEQRRPNNNPRNQHQKYEMKSLKPGNYKVG